MQTYCFPRIWHRIIPEPKAQIQKARSWSIILGRRLPPTFLVSFWGRQLLIIMATWWYVYYSLLNGWYLIVDVVLFVMLDNKSSYRRSMHTYLQAARLARKRCIRNFWSGYRRRWRSGLRNRRPLEFPAHREASRSRQRTPTPRHPDLWSQFTFILSRIHPLVAKF